jgi:nucleotide-binding universal stress UspA family protein
MTVSPPARPLVVVGVDGSECSERSVRWAADYVNASGGTLELVIAWHWPPSFGYPVALPDYDPEGMARVAVEKVAAELHVPRERLRTTVVAGAPAQQLIAASENADLLVVGSRGHGGFAGLLLGSVSTHCVHHAHCPVLVVRPADAAAA